MFPVRTSTQETVEGGNEEYKTDKGPLSAREKGTDRDGGEHQEE